MVIEVLNGPTALIGRKWYVPKGVTAWQYLVEVVREDLANLNYGKYKIYVIYIDEELIK